MSSFFYPPCSVSCCLLLFAAVCVCLFCHVISVFQQTVCPLSAMRTVLMAGRYVT